MHIYIDCHFQIFVDLSVNMTIQALNKYENIYLKKTECDASENQTLMNHSGYIVLEHYN